jgi:hypothetical protein
VSKTVSRGARALGFPDSTRKKSTAVVNIRLTPAVLNLAENRKVDVLVKVVNTGKRAVLMEFPNSQRAEAVLRDSKGSIVARASDEQDFVEEPAVVSLNPGERIEYPVILSTRALKAGERYRLEASIVNQNGMIAHETVSPK